MVPMTFIDLLPVLFIMLVGLPHGAGDGLLAFKNFKPTPKGWVVFVSSYLAIAGIVVALWYVYPVLGLLLFLIQSCIHFGLGDVSASDLIARGTQSQNRLHHWARIIAMGGGPVLLIPLFHPIPVNDVFVLMSGQAASYLIIYVIFLLPVWLAAFGIMLSYLPKTGGRETALLLLLVGLYFILPPLWSFAIYFCCVHSLRHFVVLNTQIDGGLVQSGHLGQILLFSALPIGVIFLFALQAQAHFTDALTAGLFIGLAALTVPHMVLVDGLRKHHKFSI
jgi:Brp/Blh family beta-carotene 15,15'-monooxygenase